MRSFVRWLLDKALWVSLAGTALALVGAFYSVRLYKNLHPDIEELLPKSTRSVMDFDEVAHRLKAVESLVVLVFSEDLNASRRFVDALGERLKAAPPDVVSFVSYRIDGELKFFKQREPLFIDTPDLLRIKQYLKERVAYEKRVFFNIFPVADLPPKPRLDVAGLKKKYLDRASDYGHFKDGYYATPDEKVRLVVAYMSGKGLEKAHRLKAEVEKAVAGLNPKSFSPGLQVKYTGNVENLIEESAALVADLEFSTIVVLILEALVLFLFYRSATATAALLASLFMGTFWTFGVAYFIVSYLNANTAFLASIIVGNGINFGIILLARYLEERRGGEPNARAIETAMFATAPATAVAAIASGLSYGSLMLTAFRGFNQFGAIGLVGMILCWISSYTLLPAYLVLIGRFNPAVGSLGRAPKAFIAAPLARFIDRYSRPICFGVAGVTALSFLSILLAAIYRPALIETNLSKLKDKRCQTEGSGFLYHYIDDIFGHSLSPMAILPQTHEQTRRIAQLLEKKKREDGASSLITTVQTVSDFVPADQERKIELVHDIQAMIKPYMLDNLSPDERSLVDQLTAAKDLRSFTQAELPAAILDRFREQDGSTGKIVVVDKKVEPTGTDDAKSLISFVKTARRITDEVAPGAPVAGQLPIISDMIEAIRQDGPKATLCAFLTVVVLLILLFRHATTIGLAVLALVLGVLWLFAIMLGFHLKINFLNFIALPITFGIGVDYGVNIFQRYRQDGDADILDVVSKTGGAVMLCSVTTMIGYGSLLLAGNQAFVSFGRLAVLGELTCITAAIVALPAVLRFRSKRRQPAKRPVATPMEHAGGLDGRPDPQRHHTAEKIAIRSGPAPQ